LAVSAPSTQTTHTHTHTHTQSSSISHEPGLRPKPLPCWKVWFLFICTCSLRYSKLCHTEIIYRGPIMQNSLL